MKREISLALLCILSLTSASPFEGDWIGIKIEPERGHGTSKLQAAVGDPGTPPVEPASYPPVDQSLMISGALLDAPLVTQALANVVSAVPANLLSIPPSTYVSGATVKYNSNAAANCYWPQGQCIRRQAGVGFVSDVYTCTGPNQWGLTYDDGPTFTPGTQHNDDSIAISNQLTAMGVHGTFFVTGSRVTENPDALKQLDAAGHQIASHTWTHHPLTSLTNAQIVAEIKYTEAIIYKTIGKIPTYLRPPYGDIDDRVRAIANALGYRLALWERDSEDASLTETSANELKSLNTILSWFSQQASFVSLEHDISKFTSRIAVAALKAMDQAQKSGSFKWKLMAMAECNGHTPYSYAGGAPIGGNSTTNATATTVVRTIATTIATTTSPARTANVTVSSPTATVGSLQIGNGRQVGSSAFKGQKLDFTSFALAAVLMVIVRLF